MATYEHNALQQYKDRNGNMHIIYPVTKAENVDGLYESPALTGVPTAPTAASGTNTTQIATTKFVQTELSEIKKELSDGMTDVAAAITEKGVETATNATLALAAANIRKIKTGGGELHGATIAVTTAEETLVGMTVTLSKENATVQNKTFDENGTCSFTDIQVGGDYTISSGNGEINVSETISITGDNIVNKTILHLELMLILDGLVAMPLNDVATWLRTNSTGETSSKGYTTLAQVIADTTTLNNLMANKSAMQYLARSIGFADEGCASETFMIYLGKSTYLDSTVLNSNLWVSKIKSSSYWDKIYTQQFIIYGGAYETITIDGYAGSFTTNADGSVTHALPLGTITLTGSVSGQSFTRKIVSSTTEVYVMPEGALYWYGNKCIWLTGGFVNYSRDPYTSLNPTFNSSDIYFPNASYAPCQYSTGTANKIDLSNFNKIKSIIKASSTNAFTIVTQPNTRIIYPFRGDVCNNATSTTNMDKTLSSKDNQYIGMCTNDDHGSCTLYALWLE